MLRFRIQALVGWLKADAMTKRYMRYQKRKWSESRRVAIVNRDKVLLVPFCTSRALIHCYAEILPRWGRLLSARIVIFDFRNAQMDPCIAALFHSFGARVELIPDTRSSILERAIARAHEIFASLRTKDDVALIREHGILLGDLIYDTYLRDLLLPTVDIADVQLCNYIRDALIYLYTSKLYFSSHDVKGVFIDHLVYLWQGVLQRVAMKQDVPVYTLFFNPRPGIHRIDLVVKQSELAATARFNYWLYPQIFARLPASEQEEALRKGRDHIEHRLAGGVQHRVLPGQSAYGVPGEGTVLLKTNKKKILILLHDFCDAVHGYRHLLFPDFYDWIHFLLKEASATPFEWYVKPHPNLNDYRRRGIHSSNQVVIDELHAKYPEIHFLDSMVSNRQLINEGISALFTMHGTAGHEFPYLGVHTVNSGDNPHAAYPFSVTASSREEYAKFIRSAGSLDWAIDRDKIAEFCYMHYIFAPEKLGAPVSLFDPMPKPSNSPSKVFEAALRASSPEMDAKMDAFVEDCLMGRIPPCVML